MNDSLVAAPATVAARWRALADHLNEHYHDMDLDAWAIACACCASHFFRNSKPLWLWLIGPSRTGKSVLIEALRGIPSTEPMDEISSDKTLLSGFVGSARASLLDRAGNHIWLFKDFTVMLAKHEKQRDAIMAQLRVLHDGNITRQSGVDKDQAWTGRVTIVAGVTPAIEREVEVLRELGERFLHLRWHRGDAIATGRKAIEQLMRDEKALEGTTSRLVREFVDAPTLPPPSALPTELIDPLIHIAELGAHLKVGVIRDRFGSQGITDIPEAEGVAGMAKSLARLLQCHAALFRRPILPSDLRLAKRIMYDSVRWPRLKVYRSLPPDGTPMSEAEVIRLSEMPRSSVRRHLEELEAIGVVAPQQSDGVEKFHCLTRRFVEINAGING